MRLRFRNAEERDLVVIRQCVEEAYRPYVAHLGVEPAPLSTDYAAHIRRGNVLVATSPEGEFVGILLSYADNGALVVDNVAIVPRYQRRGALVDMCAQAVRIAEAAGLGKIRTFTNQKLTRNIAMYEKLGLSIDRIEEKIDRTAVHMTFSLEELRQAGPSLAKRIMRERSAS